MNDGFCRVSVKIVIDCTRLVRRANLCRVCYAETAVIRSGFCRSVKVDLQLFSAFGAYYFLLLVLTKSHLSHF